MRLKYVDTLLTLFEKEDLDMRKAKKYFKDTPHQMDIYFDEQGYTDEEVNCFYVKVYSRDRLMRDSLNIASSMKNSAGTLELGEKMYSALRFMITKTTAGLLKHCEEDMGDHSKRGTDFWTGWIDSEHGDTVYRLGWFHYVMCNELDGAFHQWINGKTAKYVLCSIPPQHCKSTIFHGALLALIFGNRPQVPAIIGSYNGDSAVKQINDNFYRTIKTDAYRKAFGGVFNCNLSVEEKKRLREQGVPMPSDSAHLKETTKGGRIWAHGMGNLTGNPAKVMIIDDPVKDVEQAESDSQMMKLQRQFDSSAMSRARDNTLVSVVHTRWRNIDPIGYLLDKVRRLKEINQDFGREIVNLCFRAEFDPNDDFKHDFRKKKGQPLWASVSKTAYMNAKLSDPMTWDAVYQQNPLESYFELIKKDWITMYSMEEYEQFEFERIVISIDTSYNDKETSDGCAIIPFGITKNGDYIQLPDGYYDRTSFLGSLEVIDKMIERYPDYHAIIIEVKANGQAVFETLKRKYSRVIPIDVTESKKARLLSCSPVIESKRLFLPNNTLGKATLKQLIDFRGVGKHEKDDLVDATTQIIRWYDPQFKAFFSPEKLLAVGTKRDGELSIVSATEKKREEAKKARQSNIFQPYNNNPKRKTRRKLDFIKKL